MKALATHPLVFLFEHIALQFIAADLSRRGAFARLLGMPKKARRRSRFAGAKRRMRRRASPPNLKVYCNCCGRDTDHNRVRDPYVPLASNGMISWQLIECRGCHDVAAYRIEYSDGNPRALASAQVHPLRQRKRPEVYQDIAPTLRAVYEETIGAFNSSFPLLCAGGLRALVEGICDDQKIVEGPVPHDKHGRRKNNLECRIEGLAE